MKQFLLMVTVPIDFERPETHIFEKEERVNYGLYADQNPGRNVDDNGMYEGLVELRGLRDGIDYTINHYESGIDFGTLTGPAALIETEFTNISCSKLFHSR